MSDKSALKKFIHDLSNKIMILEGNLSIVKIKPEYDIQQIISNLDKNIVSVVSILKNMREHVTQDDETDLVSLLFISEAKKYKTEFALESELERIKQSSISHNTENRISGFLLYADGYFVQYIEGNAKDVEKLFLKISLAPYHHSITLLSHEQIIERSFKEWTNLYRMDIHNHSKVPDILKSIIGKKQRLLTKPEVQSFINFVSLINDNKQSKAEGSGIP